MMDYSVLYILNSRKDKHCVQQTVNGTNCYSAIASRIALLLAMVCNKAFMQRNILQVEHLLCGLDTALFIEQTSHLLLSLTNTGRCTPRFCSLTSSVTLKVHFLRFVTLVGGSTGDCGLLRLFGIFGFASVKRPCVTFLRDSSRVILLV